jgi:hypothetical protein
VNHPEVAKVRSSNPSHEQGYFIKNVKDLTDEDVLFDRAEEKNRRRDIAIALHGNKYWHERPIGFMVATIFCSVAAAYMIYRFGWNR